MPSSTARNGRMWRLTLKTAPAIILLAALAFDHSAILNFSIIPAACVLSMVVFSFLLPSRVMIGWTAVYILAVSATLWMRREAWGGSMGNADALVVTRTFAVAAAGMLACLLAKHREQGDRVVHEINRLLDQMEIPVITSDRDGWLLHMNPKATKLLGGATASGSPFFEHFSLIAEKGKSIKSYVDLATGVKTGPVSTSLAVGPNRSQVISAVMLRVNIGDRGRIMTLLDLSTQKQTLADSADPCA